MTTVRDFTHEMNVRHIGLNTHIRVIINEPEALVANMSPIDPLPRITPEEQRHQLNHLPKNYNSYASAEMVRLTLR